MNEQRANVVEPSLDERFAAICADLHGCRPFADVLAIELANAMEAEQDAAAPDEIRADQIDFLRAIAGVHPGIELGEN